MRKRSSEFEDFNAAMDAILKADPKIIKEQMEQDARDRAKARKAKRASLASGLSDPD